MGIAGIKPGQVDRKRTINTSKKNSFETLNRGLDLGAHSSVVTRIYNVKYCLSIGINLYENWPRLSNAVFDATEFARVLKENFSFDLKVLIDRDATKNKINESIVDEISKRLTEDDLLIVFFAGHGHTINLPNGRQKGFLVPFGSRRDYDSDLISMDTMYEWLSYIKSRHILCIFDACFSGTATVRSSVSRRESDYLTRHARKTITAGGAEQTVIDGGWNDHSIFTGLLIQQLIGIENFDERGHQSVTHLFASLTNKIPDSVNQTPTYGSFPGDAGGDIIFERGVGVFSSSPISLVPPPFIAENTAGTIENVGAWFNKCAPELQSDLEYQYVNSDVSLFADDGQQWAFIVGAHPAKILGHSTMLRFIPIDRQYLTLYILVTTEECAPRSRPLFNVSKEFFFEVLIVLFLSTCPGLIPAMPIN